MLIRIFAMAIPLFPLLKSSTVSKLKVEKVLNPPQKPITIRTANELFVKIFSLKIPTTIARTTQLIIFDTSVASGKTN